MTQFLLLFSGLGTGKGNSGGCCIFLQLSLAYHLGIQFYLCQVMNGVEEGLVKSSNCQHHIGVVQLIIYRVASLTTRSHSWVTFTLCFYLSVVSL